MIYRKRCVMPDTLNLVSDLMESDILGLQG